MDLEYTLIDCATGLIYGPYETFLPSARARRRLRTMGNHQSRGQSCRLEPHTIDRPDRNRAGGVNREASVITRPYVVKSRGLFTCHSKEPFKISRSQIEA